MRYRTTAAALFLSIGVAPLWAASAPAQDAQPAYLEVRDVPQGTVIEHTFRVTRVGHTYDVWQRYLYEVAPLLFR